MTRGAGLLGVAGLAGLLVLAEALPRLGLVNDAYLPPTSRIAAALGDELVTGEFWRAVGDTLTGWAIGLLIAVVAGVALYAAVRRNSAICLLLASIAGVGSLLSCWEWIFAPGTFTASRWLLALSAAALVMGGLALRDSAARQSEILIDAAGLAILFIGIQGVVPGTRSWKA